MDGHLPVDALRGLALRLDQTWFSGVVRVDHESALVHESAHGFADRAHAIAMTPATRIAVASGAKVFTALTVMALVERGTLALDTTARSLLGADLPLVDDRVTVEHLLAHRSGIGDYLDESVLGDITDHVLTIPVHRLATSEDHLAVLDSHPQVSEPGARFAYNNGGYVLLALLAERAAGMPFHDLVDRLVIEPAQLTHTGWLRSDEPQGDAAVGYLHDTGPRTNVLHLPVRGSGDGGISTTAADVATLWRALDMGQVVTPATWALMTQPHSVDTGNAQAYGLGVWLQPEIGAVALEGYDAGSSFRSVHQAATGLTWSVLSNTSEGAWPVARELAALLGR